VTIRSWWASSRARTSSEWPKKIPPPPDLPFPGRVSVGTGKLKEHYEALASRGAQFYLSGMSAKARGVTEDDLAGKPAQFATPAVLLRLTLEHDRVLTY
jgi:hypothetical protein